MYKNSYKFLVLLLATVLAETVSSEEIDRKNLRFYIECRQQDKHSLDKYKHFPANDALRKLGSNDEICVDLSGPVVFGDDILKIEEVTNNDVDRSGMLSIDPICANRYQVWLNVDGAAKIQTLTKGNRGRRMVVVMNGVTISVPVVAAEITESVFMFDVSSVGNCNGNIDRKNNPDGILRRTGFAVVYRLDAPGQSGSPSADWAAVSSGRFSPLGSTDRVR